MLCGTSNILLIKYTISSVLYQYQLFNCWTMQLMLFAITVGIIKNFLIFCIKINSFWLWWWKKMSVTRKAFNICRWKQKMFIISLCQYFWHWFKNTMLVQCSNLKCVGDENTIETYSLNNHLLSRICHGKISDHSFHPDRGELL